MTTMNAGSERRLYRDADRAILGGVCAGLAGFLGFNLKMTRFLAFIAFLMAMPIAVIGYLAAVFLIPSASNGDYVVVEERRYSRRRKSRNKKEKAEIRKPSIADDVNRRCESLDERLVRLEKRVTSRRFQLEQELSKL
jgi:phage shock protein C